MAERNIFLANTRAPIAFDSYWFPWRQIQQHIEYNTPASLIMRFNVVDPNRPPTRDQGPWKWVKTSRSFEAPIEPI